MKRIVAVTAVAVLLAAGSFAGGTWWTQRSVAAHASVPAATVYTCPMHPDYHAIIPATARSAAWVSRPIVPARPRAATPPPARCRPAQCR